MQAVPGADCDILVFMETWVREGGSAPDIAGFTTHLDPPRSRRLQSGGTRGGIAVYVADALAPAVTTPATGPQACFAHLRFDGAVGRDEDAHTSARYVPPEGSRTFGGRGPAV